MGFIPVDEDFFDHKKTRRLRRLLGVDHAEIYLIRLWRRALIEAQNGDLGDYAPAEIEEMVGWGGEPCAFVRAAITAGFLDHPAESRPKVGRKSADMVDDFVAMEPETPILGLSIHNWWDRCGRHKFSYLKKNKHPVTPEEFGRKTTPGRKSAESRPKVGRKPAEIRHKRRVEESRVEESSGDARGRAREESPPDFDEHEISDPEPDEQDVFSPRDPEGEDSGGEPDEPSGSPPWAPHRIEKPTLQSQTFVGEYEALETIQRGYRERLNDGGWTNLIRRLPSPLFRRYLLLECQAKGWRSPWKDGLCNIPDDIWEAANRNMLSPPNLWTRHVCECGSEEWPSMAAPNGHSASELRCVACGRPA